MSGVTTARTAPFAARLTADMWLALKEMRRAKARFGFLIAAIGLLVFLILFQQSLQNGLLASFVGAIRNQSAPVLVYSVDGQRVIQGSTITPDLQQLITDADGVAATAPIYQGTFSVKADGELGETALIGYGDQALGAPSELVDGRFPNGDATDSDSSVHEAIAADADIDKGYAIGDTVSIVAPAGSFDITIVGLAAQSQLNAGPTLFVTSDTYLAAVAAANPDAGEPPPNVFGVQPADGTDPQTVADAINAQSNDLDALTRTQAADLTPGVAQVRQSFQVIFLLYGLVIPCVMGLFFLIITFQKSAALTLLHAIGIQSRVLVRSLLTQAVIIVALGFLIGLVMYIPLSQQRVGTIPLRFETNAVVFWGIALLVLGVGSSLLAARRVLAIDPAEATHAGGIQ